MKKYILVIILSIISLVNFNLANAQLVKEDDTCKSNNKKVGDACTYKWTQGEGRRGNTTGTAQGFCDRSTGDPDPKKNPLECKEGGDDWGDCVVEGDACLEKGKTGTCVVICGRGCRTVCDTNKTPPGNPGGRSPGPGDGPCKDCGGNKCDPGQVCAEKDGASQCVQDKGSAGKCGASPCDPGQVCAEKDGASQCVVNKCTGGGGAGNGGGGTPSPGNDTPTDASSPQTVSFINPSRFNSIIDLVAGVINALLGILGAITVGVLVKSGFEYMISSDPGAVGKALDGIKNAIVGLMIIMGAFLITQYVISALAG
ncbi:hypothetical protein EBU71_16950 [bacterium]|nr:hypothetical protein [Candidatus Elulimicrobium humile]